MRAARSLCTLAIVTIAGLSSLHAGTITGKVVAKGMRHNGDAVIYIDSIPGKTFPPPKEHAVMDQKDMTFVPHVLPVLVGTTVDFLNSDPFLHNVFTPDKCADRFNLGSWPQGQVRSYTFKQACVATLLCNVHPEMEAYIVAVPTPYFAVSARDGTFRVENVPDGKYTLKVWHPKLKGVTREVDVKGETRIEIELGG